MKSRYSGTQIYFILSCLLSLLFFAVANVNAQPPSSFTTIEDDFATFNDSLLNNNTLLNVRASGAPGGGCVSQHETFLKFDLSALPTGSTIDTATLTLTGTGTTGLPLEIWGSNNDTWTEGNGQILWANKPPLNVDLNTRLTSSGAGTITFATSTQFASFVQTQLASASDRIVTIAVIAQPTGNCGVSATNQTLEAGTTDNSFSANTFAPTAAPTLNVTGLTPTSINLQGVGASSGNNSIIWLAVAMPLFVGLVLLAVRRKKPLA